MRNLGWVFAGLCLLVVAGLGVAAQEEEKAKVQVVDNGECLAGLEIWGAWKLKKDITEFSGGKVDDSSTYVFEKNDESTERITTQAEKLLAELRGEKAREGDAIERALSEIYAVGKFTRVDKTKKEQTSDFALVTFMGNPTLFLLRTKSDGRFDWETSSIAFVRAPENDNDLLFMGGDHKDEEFTCLQRSND
jgi:hypothetical protein